MEGIKNRIDVVLDCMNTLRFLTEIGTSKTEKVFADVRSNDVLVYRNQYMWDLCEALDRMPDITPIEWESDTDCEYRVAMYYRGVEFHTYIRADEKEFFEDKIVEYLAKKEQDEQNADD